MLMLSCVFLHGFFSIIRDSTRLRETENFVNGTVSFVLCHNLICINYQFDSFFLELFVIFFISSFVEYPNYLQNSGTS